MTPVAAPTPVAVLPVDPAAPGEAPVLPVTPEPPAAAGLLVPPAPDDAAPDGDAGAVVVVGVAASKLLVKPVVQVTVLPPPFDEPLHCVTVTGSAVAPPVTVHCTRVMAPPPFPEPLHWVTVAPVVAATGEHTSVGAVPPPVPEPMH